MEMSSSLSLVTASISFAVSETRLFRPLREWVRGRSKFFGDLLSCGYCLGHWVAFALVVICRFTLFNNMVAAGLFPDGFGHRLAQRLSVGAHVPAYGEG